VDPADAEGVADAEDAEDAEDAAGAAGIVQRLSLL
jgi:hypothetical protein